MKAEHVHNFTRGGNPYKKMGVGRHRQPVTDQMRDFVVEQIYHWWFQYNSAKNKGEGISVHGFVDDIGIGLMIQAQSKWLTKQNAKKFLHEVNKSLKNSGIKHQINTTHFKHTLTYDIYIYKEWE